jgi:hypothetical protein
MPPEEIAQRLQTRPFQPFRIYVSDGRTYEIRHPEMVMVTTTTLIIGLPNPVHPSLVYQGSAPVSLLHVTGLEPIAFPAPTSSN